MIDSQELLNALKAHEESSKSPLEKIRDWLSIATPLAGGVNTLYKVGSSAATINAHSMSNTAQGGLSIAGSVLDLMTSFPNMILIATSDKKELGDKLREIVPQLLLTLLGIAASVLGILVLNAIGGLVLATAGAALGVAAASVFLGLMGYHLLRAWVVQKAVDTVFEDRVDKIEGVFSFIKTWIFDPKELNVKVSERYPLEANLDHLKSLKMILKQQLSKEELLKPIIVKLNKNMALDEKELSLVHDIQDTLGSMFELQQTMTLNTTDSKDKREFTVENRKALANENLLATGVNFLLSGAGVLLATMGLLTLVAPFIAAPPLLGVILGAMGLALVSFVLIKFLVELKFAWDEGISIKQLKTEILEGFIMSAQQESVAKIMQELNSEIKSEPKADCHESKANNPIFTSAMPNKEREIEYQTTSASPRNK